MHASNDPHETPASWAAEACAGFAVGWIVQPVPLQRSATVSLNPPIAVHALTALTAGARERTRTRHCPQETASSGPAGGEAVSCQCPASHSSATDPTAMHSLRAKQDTAESS